MRDYFGHPVIRQAAMKINSPAMHSHSWSVGFVLKSNSKWPRKKTKRFRREGGRNSGR